MNLQVNLKRSVGKVLAYHCDFRQAAFLPGSVWVWRKRREGFSQDGCDSQEMEGLWRLFLKRKMLCKVTSRIYWECPVFWALLQPLYIGAFILRAILRCRPIYLRVRKARVQLDGRISLGWPVFVGPSLQCKVYLWWTCRVGGWMGS